MLLSYSLKLAENLLIYLYKRFSVTYFMYNVTLLFLQASPEPGYVRFSSLLGNLQLRHQNMLANVTGNAGLTSVVG